MNLMFIKKIEYKISKFIQKLSRVFRGMGFSWGYWIFSLICVVSIVLLGVNIFRIIKKGYERYEIIQSEKRRLDELSRRNTQLQDELKYYSSKEFVDVKAREELNLAFPNQKLVYIEKDTSVVLEGDSVEEKELTPSWRLWYELIF